MCDPRIAYGIRLMGMDAHEKFLANDSALPDTLENLAHKYAIQQVAALVEFEPKLMPKSDDWFIAYTMSYDMGLLACHAVIGRVDVADDVRKYVNHSVRVRGEADPGYFRWRVVQALTDDRYLLQRDTFYGKIVPFIDITHVR